MSITVRTIQNYQVQVEAGNHSFVSDEPADIGGDDLGPNPFDLLLAGLGSCVVITLHMYANRKKWPLERVEIELDYHSMPAAECPDCKSAPGATVSVIDKRMTFHGDLTQEQLQRLAQIAERCPVNKALLNEIKIRSSVTNLDS